MDLDFETEPITISVPFVGDYEIPSIPFENNSNGNWILTNNEDNLIITDNTTNIESFYEIIVLTEDVAVVSGTIPFDTSELPLPQSIGILDVAVEMVLEKEVNKSLISEQHQTKKLITVIDILGQVSHNHNIIIKLYDDGSIEKQYVTNF